MKSKTRYSSASKNRWASIPPEKRSLMMRRLAKKKHSLLTPEERSEHALKMVKAREKQRKINNKKK